MEKEYRPYRRSVFYYETDRMGIVHHSNYLRMFEEARLDWLLQIGVPYDVLEREGILIPVLSMNVKYRQHLMFGDEIELYSWSVKMNGLKFTCAYHLYNAATGALCTTGESSHCFLDRELKPFRFRQKFPEYYSLFEEAVGFGRDEREE